jgi:hypothetical protein
MNKKNFTETLLLVETYHCDKIKWKKTYNKNAEANKLLELHKDAKWSTNFIAFNQNPSLGLHRLNQIVSYNIVKLSNLKWFLVWH